MPWLKDPFFCFALLFVLVICNNVGNRKNGGKRMKPLIGITISYDGEHTLSLRRDYHDAVLQAGGIPILLPYLTDEQEMEELIDKLDGLILSGGFDVDPAWFGEEPHSQLGEVVPERDEVELKYCRLFLKTNKPLFAICRGCQVLNVAVGGTLYQDLPSQWENALQHSQRAPRFHPSHSIQMKEGSLLAKISGKLKQRVNSFHHQAIKEVKAPFTVVATSPDGVIEAIESTVHPFVLGVQWHPEGMAEKDSFAQALFSAFVEQCRREKETRLRQVV
jgi:putative glutamine amidotransferase